MVWDAKSFDSIPTSDGRLILDDDQTFHQFLVTLKWYGVVVIERLPAEPNIIERLPEKIGVIRASNFGRIFDVHYRKGVDSNAYTGVELKPHNDLATREYMPGLQFLLCLENDAPGGESTISDGFAVAELLRRNAPDRFQLLSNASLDFVNKARCSDYRASAPLFVHGTDDGAREEMRWTTWLRAPLRGNLE